MTHALAVLEADLRARARRGPPTLADWHGTKWNKGRRALALESALADYRRNLGRGMSQEERDRRELGTWQEWIRGSRSQAAAVQSIAKFQASTHRRP